MAKKVECDNCGKQADEGDGYDGLSHKWFRIEQEMRYVSWNDDRGPWHLCSWPCVSAYGVRKTAETEPAEEREGSGKKRWLGG